MSIPLIDDAVTFLYPLIAGLAATLHPVGGAAAAIVVCTVALRALLLPLTVAAVRGERRRSILAPKVAELRRRHAGDPGQLRTALADLYRDERTSPFAGFGPLLVQSPFFLIWYRVFTASRVAGHPNTLLAHSQLAARLVGGGHPLVFLPLLAALAILGFVAMRRARHVAAATGSPAPRGVLAFLPFISLFTAAVIPLAAVLYLVTTQTWSALENAVLRRGLPAAAKNP